MISASWIELSATCNSGKQSNSMLKTWLAAMLLRMSLFSHAAFKNGWIIFLLQLLTCGKWHLLYRWIQNKTRNYELFFFLLTSQTEPSQHERRPKLERLCRALCSVRGEMPSPKQFRGLITAGTLTVETVQNAGIEMHLQFAVAEDCMQLHCDTHQCHSEIHPPIMFNLLWVTKQMLVWNKCIGN